MALPRPPAGSVRRRRPTSFIRLATLLLLGLVSCSLLADAQQLRIPLRRIDVRHDEHPTRSAEALSRQLAATPSHAHHAVNLAMDASRPVSLKNYFNRMYTGEVQVGTPAQPFQLVFDTGSADMWLFSAQTSSQKMSYVRYYDYTQSSTSAVTSTPWSIQYGKGSASGVLASDHVTLAGVQAKDLVFARATSWSDDFESPEMPLDGLLGLAFSKVNSANTKTIVDTLKDQGVINNRVFSFYLTSDNPEGSEFVLGAPDLTKAAKEGNLTYLPLASSGGMWIVSMQGVFVGNTQTDYCSAADCAVLVDTGTSFVGMPTDAFNDFARRISSVRRDCGIESSSGLIRCDRDTSSGLPDVSFSLQGHQFTLKGSDYFDMGQRVIGFMPIDVGSTGSFWILGDTFLKTYYTVFDMDAGSIGITGAKPGLPYTPPSEASPFTRLSWQLLVVVGVGIIVLITVLSCCIRCCCFPKQERAAAVPASQYRDFGGEAAAAPYVLHQSPPMFQSAPHRSQPAQQPHNLRARSPKVGNTSSAHAQYPAMAANARAPRAANRSEFAQDFYSTVPPTR